MQKCKEGKRVKREKGLQSPRSLTNNPKTQIVVAIVGGIDVAKGRTAPPRTDDPRAAAQ
jgi:hypothetical protein